MNQFSEKDLQQTSDYYNEHSEKFFNDTYNLNMDHLYCPFIEHVPVGGLILDAGCGSGRDSLHFKQNGFQVTAIDNAEELVIRSSQLLKQKVLHLSFDEISFDKEFDAIWACASLLHVPKSNMQNILRKFEKSLKPNGVIFASFKYGETEGFRNGRFFNFYNEFNFAELIDSCNFLSILKTWQSKDTRAGREDEIWLDVLLTNS